MDFKEPVSFDLRVLAGAAMVLMMTAGTMGSWLAAPAASTVTPAEVREIVREGISAHSTEIEIYTRRDQLLKELRTMDEKLTALGAQVEALVDERNFAAERERR